ncbi:serine hydrolase domain-containing protein [Tenacibaculum jejuense]|uniref:Beta-lactamase n=1 Tax=Tenacibaculum jejuense TaxID=584609 RepID=A0A238UC40_9FLAO|nr:serine hydrolase domain-containing protein [Tenacibaculum jejuense]SNR16741.1 Beta-lactamase [Tenacibaculum jejuense]
MNTSFEFRDYYLFYLFLCLNILLSCNSKIESKKQIKNNVGNLTPQEKITNNLTPYYYLEDQTPITTIKEVMEKDNITGARIIFVDSSKISWSKNYGYANIKDTIKVSNNTLFSGASLSKPITTVTALKLVEKGILSLDDDINKILKRWKIPENNFTKNSKVTLRSLIGHRSGLNRSFWMSYSPNEKLYTNAEILNQKDPKQPRTKMINIPNTSYKYSNPGYQVIELLIEDATGIPFEKVVDSLIFKPCGMKNSTFSQPIPKDLIKQKATGYSKNKMPYPYQIYPFKGAGGIWTTPDDLGLFLITLFNDHVKGKQILLSQKMTNQIFNQGGEMDKLGFTLWNGDEDIIFRHTGSNIGFNCFMLGSIKKQQAVVLMTNSDNAQKLQDYIQRAVPDAYDWAYLKSKPYIKSSVNLNNFTKYFRQYNWENNYVLLSKENNSAFININNERFKLIPVGKRTLLLKEKPLLIKFPKKENNKELIIYKSNGDYSVAYPIL